MEKFFMDDAMRYIRFFVMVLFCANSFMMMASDRFFDPYSSLRAGSSGGKVSFGTFAAEMMKYKIVFGVKQAYSVTSKIIAEKPKETLAMATAVALLGLAWYKKESIKKLFNSESMQRYKEYMASVRDSAVTAMDNQIAKIPSPFYEGVVLLRGLIAFLYRTCVAIENQYLAGLVLSPIVGHISSYTPLAVLGGAKTGWVLSGIFLARGYSRIDTGEVKQKVDVLQKVVEQGQVVAIQNHDQMLENIQNLEERIDQASSEIKKEIELSSKGLEGKVDSLCSGTEKSCAMLTEKIAGLSSEVCQLSEQVSLLPSKADNQKVIDEALSNTIKSFKALLVSNVEELDQKTKKKLDVIGQQLVDGLQKIDGKQIEQTQELKELERAFSMIIDERESNIKAVTALVDSTKLSNGLLLKKFGSLENIFKNVQTAYQESDEKFGQLLAQNKKDSKRLESIIAEQINGFTAINNKLSKLQENIDVVDQKTETQYVTLANKMDVGIQEQKEVQQCIVDVLNNLKKELLKIQEEATNERKAVEESLRSELKQLRDDLKVNAVENKQTQSEILAAVKKNKKTKRITAGESSYQLPYTSIPQITSKQNTVAIQWQPQVDRNNDRIGLAYIKGESYS